MLLLTLCYREWSKYANAPQNSPIFNGDAYSMSGNGEYIPSLDPVVLGVPGAADAIVLERGLGGGCVTSVSCSNPSLLGILQVDSTVLPDQP